MKQHSAAFEKNRTRLRASVLSWGWSLCAHLAYIVALAFVVTGGVDDRKPLEVIAISDATASQELTLIPEFELVSPSEFELTVDEMPIEIVELSTNLKPIQLAKAADSPQPESAVENSAEKSEAASDLASVSMPRARAIAVTDIQGRVGKAGGKRGEVQFALAWKNVNDVDLHVITPSGDHISHQNRRSQCLGMLDVDMNVKGDSEEPVENIRWIRQAPWGRYTVLIHLFRLHPDGLRRPQSQSAYELLTQLGNEVSIQAGTVSSGSQVAVLRFIYFPQQLPQVERQQGLKQIQALQELEELAAGPLLEDAKQSVGSMRQGKLRNIVLLYPHTEAAIEAMQLVDGKIIKR